jgi:hypothetical protein
MSRRTDHLIAEHCKKLMSISPLDRAWLAGLYEGEGCFSICKIRTYRKTSGFTRARYVYHNPVVQVGMTDKDILDRVASILQWHVVGPYRSDRNGVNPRSDFTHYRPLFYVTLSGKAAMQLCSILYPLLGERRRRQIDKLRQANDHKLLPLLPVDSV